MAINYQQIAEEVWEASKGTETTQRLAIQFEIKYPDMTDEDFAQVDQQIETLILREVEKLLLELTEDSQ